MYTSDIADAIRYAVSTIQEKLEYDLFYGKRLESPLRKIAAKQINRVVGHWDIQDKFHVLYSFPDTKILNDSIKNFRAMDYEEA